MSLLKPILFRIRNISLKRLLMCAEAAHKRYGKGVIRVLFDMCGCGIKYKTGYLDYLTFGFAAQNAENRATFVTMTDNYRIVDRLNNDENGREIFRNKIKFNGLFNRYLGRDYRNLNEINSVDFAEFIQGEKYIFAKNPNGYGGLGVKRIELAECDPEALYIELKAGGFTLVEHLIPQHSALSELSPGSVNSLRICTVRKDGEIHFLYSLIRMSSDGSSVDNITSGGMYSPIKDGAISAPAYCSRTGRYYFTHPVSGTELVGFRIPFYNEALELIRNAAVIVDGINYVGWDIAITPDGPVLIEGNTVPGYDVSQNYFHLGDSRRGIKPDFERIFGSGFFGGRRTVRS